MKKRKNSKVVILKNIFWNTLYFILYFSSFSEIHKPVLRLLSDSVEKCRELSASYVGEVLRASAKPEAHLPYVVPAMAERLGAKEIVESCEEIRLQLVEILIEVVEKTGNRIAPYIDEFAKVITRYSLRSKSFGILSFITKKKNLAMEK